MVDDNQTYNMLYTIKLVGIEPIKYQSVPKYCNITRIY